jgi:hypothetical protein
MCAMGIDAPRLLVVSADPDRRERWARVFEGMSHQTSRCAGPTVTCAILKGHRCPLLEEADIALYDRESFVPALARALGGPTPYRAQVLVAQDDAAGRPTAVRRAGGAGGACFGSTL